MACRGLSLRLPPPFMFLSDTSSCGSYKSRRRKTVARMRMNKRSSYETVRKDGIDWLVLSGYAHIIPGNLVEKMRRVTSYPPCRILKENNVRISMLVPHPEGGEFIFAKRYKCRGLKDILKYFFVPSKAVSELPLETDTATLYFQTSSTAQT